MSMDNKAQFEPHNLATREGTKRTRQRDLVKGVRDVLRGRTNEGLVSELQKYIRAMTDVTSKGQADPSGVVGEALSQLQGANFLSEWSFHPVEALHEPIISTEAMEKGKTRLLASIATTTNDLSQPRVEGTFVFETTKQEAEKLAHQLWVRLTQLNNQIGWVLPEGARED